MYTPDPAIFERQPGFVGSFGLARSMATALAAPVGCELIWEIPGPASDLHLFVGRAFTREMQAWHDPGVRGARPSAFVSGCFFLSDDAAFGPGARVKSLSLPEAADMIVDLYEKYGTAGFARLDGEFTAVLFDPRDGRLRLLTDRCGSHDIYLRQNDTSVVFASHPLPLLSPDENFDNEAVSFYLAHEGFFPAPLTVSASVRSLGRSRFAEMSREPGRALKLRIARYWSPARVDTPSSVREADDLLHRLLTDAMRIRSTDKTALLLSGGIDSSVMANLASQSPRPVAITGTVKGWDQGECEVATSKKLADQLGMRHERVVMDPADESLADEYAECALSWMSGARLTLPLWRRYAVLIRELLGDGYRVLAGQTADTIADNNYTLPSAGYTVRRALFSSWAFTAWPLVSRLAPGPERGFGRLLRGAVSAAAGERIASMAGSLLDGFSSRDRFYAGRVFGFGETPGVSLLRFPMLTADGLERVSGRYIRNYVEPLVARMTAESFYRDMIEMSLDMNMLHLDSRLLFHVYRMEGASAGLPFMDARIIAFFGSIPYKARSIFREPKHLIRNQLRRKGVAYVPLQAPDESRTQEELLLAGVLGAYLREVISELTFPNRMPGLFSMIDEAWFEKQVTGFIAGKPGINAKFIAKLAAMEHWSRAVGSMKGKAIAPAGVGASHV